MYCTECGTAVADNSTFCTHCGVTIGQPIRAAQQGFDRTSVKWYFIAFFGAVIASMLATIFFGDPFAALVASVILIHGTLLAFSIWITSQGRIDLKHLVGSIPENYNWLPPAVFVVGMILYSLSANWITNYPIAVSWPDIYHELTQPVFLTGQETENPLAYNVLTIVLLVIIAPVVEEVFFRMILFQRLSIRWGMGAGVAVSSLLFGLVHPFGWVGAFVFGIAACVLYIRTRTIIVPIAVHALYNAIVGMVNWWAIERNWDVAVDLSAIQTELYPAIILLVLSSPIVFGLLGRWWPSTGEDLPYFVNRNVGER